MRELVRFQRRAHIHCVGSCVWCVDHVVDPSFLSCLSNATGLSSLSLSLSLSPCVCVCLLGHLVDKVHREFLSVSSGPVQEAIMQAFVAAQLKTLLVKVRGYLCVCAGPSVCMHAYVCA